MKSLLTKLAIPFFIVLALICVTPSFADAPNLHVDVVIDNSGTLAPLGGAVVRWQNRCGGSMGGLCAYGTPQTPRRYGKTGVNGKYMYTAFQKANTGQEYATILEGVTDADYPGAVRMLQPQGSKYGCGQKEHKIAVAAEGYVCDQMKSGQPDDATPFTKIGCANGWCQGDLTFTGDCTNGCPDKYYTFKCKAQKIEELGRDLKRSEVGLGADEDENAKWGFSCLTTAFCKAAGNTTPVPTGQQNNYEACNEYPSSGGGAVKKKVKLIGVQSRYDKTYIQQQSQDIPAYIVECINLNGAYKCTTGNAANDTAVFGGNNVPAGYSLEMYKSSSNTALANPVTYAQLDEDIVVISSASQAITSFFMLVYPQDKITSANQTSDSNSQRQATLTNSNECKIIQDPYGRVFDTYTLEPLADATVELTVKDAVNKSFRKAQNSDSLLQIQNPQTTANDGNFSFNVLDGVYKLTASKEDYRNAVVQDLNAMANQLYTNIYYGNEIVQKGTPQQRDIPLAPLNIQKSVEYANNNPIQVLDKSLAISNDGKTYTVKGRVSHPRATVTIVSDKSFRINSTVADSFGRFTVTFTSAQLKKGETPEAIVAVKKAVSTVSSSESSTTRVKIAN